LLCVDGILIASNGKHEVEKVEIDLNNELDMKDLGASIKVFAN